MSLKDQRAFMHMLKLKNTSAKYAEHALPKNEAQGRDYPRVT